MNPKIGMRIPPKIGSKGIRGVAEFAKSVGLEVVDIPEYTSEIKQIFEETGIEVGSIDGVGAVGQTKLLNKDDNIRSEAAEKLIQQITDVARLGGKVLFVCLAPEDINQSRADSFAIWKETFPEIIKQAEKEDVYFAIEGWPGPAPQYPTIGCTPEMWRAMFNAIPSKHLGLNFDPSHMVRLGIDYLRVLNEFGERITYCHGKDTEILLDEQYDFGILPATFDVKYSFSEGPWRYTIPGYGQVDWGKVATRLEQLNYNGPVSIELEDHRFWGSVDAESKGIIKAKEHLEKFFE
ncbi:sugar phosphate isomerase/epimerase family protein [Pseudalkalibacillus sp. A8]|uniref:sugar phosphate isomerase/epimerase family protein n=1 Tax=Pseudalkalibacillus sp. A8 TaxID=3382641 RepID=UPI0038B4484B